MLFVDNTDRRPSLLAYVRHAALEHRCRDAGLLYHVILHVVVLDSMALWWVPRGVGQLVSGTYFFSSRVCCHGNVWVFPPASTFAPPPRLPLVHPPVIVTWWVVGGDKHGNL